MAKNTVIPLLVLVLVCIAMQVSSADQQVNVAAATHGITGGLGLSGLVRSVTGITGLLGEKPADRKGPAERSSKKVSGSNN